jgi:general secretion pathway protein G
MRLTLRTRKGPRAGFTILEIMVVLLIIGLILGTVGRNAFQALFSGQEKTARNQINLFMSSLQDYWLNNNKYPDSLDALTQSEGAPGGEPYMRSIPLDPWQNEYHYEVVPGGEPLILSYGADGQPGGEGKDADITSEIEN